MDSIIRCVIIDRRRPGSHDNHRGVSIVGVVVAQEQRKVASLKGNAYYLFIYHLQQNSATGRLERVDVATGLLDYNRLTIA